ncbi:hypothetical protein [Mycolicibacterium hippocampi]|uniref:hypothetical protein n=1 Tax=Mycolicibacterium hippocampi TaxID=659824 RepID=UPI0021F2FAF9|nr:hypothetical protein [Mycolicibacterium hippocampi]
MQVAREWVKKDADRELDSALSLIEARFNDTTHHVSGLNDVLSVNHDEPLEVDLIVKRGPETTVLFEVDSEAI